MLLTGLGIIAIAALLRCPSGPGTFGSCFAGATAMIDSTLQAAATEEDIPLLTPALTIGPAATAAAPTQASQPGTAWSEALIAGTFEQLPAEPGKAAMADAPQPGADELTTGSIPAQPGVAASTAPPAAGMGGEALASADPATAMPRPRIDDARRQAAATATAAADGTAETRIVGGTGVNVRSGPSRSHGKLFALAPGAEVRVTQNKRGWLRVVDESGRTGWLYSSFLVER
jgi:hypothetical protein